MPDIEHVSLDDIEILDSNNNAIIAIAKAKEGARDRVPLENYRAEIGTTGLRIFGGKVNEEFLTELHGLRGYRVYDEMRKNDPVIGGMLFSIEQSIRRVRWFFETPRNASEAEYEKAINFGEEAKDDMSHTFNDHISEALTFLPFGYALFEPVYKERRGKQGEVPSRYNDGLIGWRKFGYRPPDTIEKWEMDEHGGIQGVWQRDIYYGKQPVFIPIDKLIHYRTKRERNNPEGISILRNSYKPYFFKKELEKFEAIALERTGAGIPVMMLPLGYTAADLEAAKKVVRRIRVDEQMGVTLPPGWELKLLRPEGRAETQTYEIAISRYTNHILMSLLTTFIAIGTNNVGSFALVRAQQDFYRLALVGWVGNMRETLNRFAVEPLFELNAGSFSPQIVSNPPQLQTSDIGEHDLETMAKFIQQAGSTGFLTPDDNMENYLRMISDLPPLKEIEDPSLDRDELREAAFGSTKPKPSQAEMDQAQLDRTQQLKVSEKAGQFKKPYGNPNANPQPVDNKQKEAMKKAVENDKKIRERMRIIKYIKGGADVSDLMEINKLIKEVLEDNGDN